MSEWISVKDRLPDENLGKVLCAVDAEAWRVLDEDHYDAMYEGPVMIANTIFARAHASQYITHWQPLPAPPRPSESPTVGQENK